MHARTMTLTALGSYAAALTLLGPVATTAAAQTVIPLHASLSSSALSADGRAVVGVTASPLVAGDADGEIDLYRYWIHQYAWQRVPLDAAFAIGPRPGAMRWAEVHGLSGDARHALVELQEWSDPYPSTDHLGRPITAYATQRIFLIVYDFDTNTRRFVWWYDSASGATGDDRPITSVLSRDGSTVAWLGPEGPPPAARNRVFVRRGDTPARQAGTTCPTNVSGCSASALAITATGDRVFFQAADLASRPALAAVDTMTLALRLYPEAGMLLASSFAVTPTGSHAVFSQAGGVGTVIFDVARGTREVVAPTWNASRGSDAQSPPRQAGYVSDDSRFVATFDPTPLFDTRSGWAVPFESFDGPPRGLSGDGMMLLGRDTVYHLDGDVDGVLDRWEYHFAALDPAGDTDGDGVTNRDEYEQGTLPNGAVRRAFAEGASSAFFDTRIHLVYVPDQPVNLPWPSATVSLRFLGTDGREAVRMVVLPTGYGHAAGVTVTARDLGVPVTEFSLDVEADKPIAVRREMVWDASVYGSHATTGGEPSTTWHFAEGATIAGLQTFFLLGNTGAHDVAVTADYLLSTGASVSRTYTVPARSRLTVWANQDGAPLDSAEFATTFTASAPIVAERAMYLSRPGQMFVAGSAAMGVVTPATDFAFAEGATGDFFDEYLLLANVSPTEAVVTITYLLPAGPPVQKTYVVAARSRRTIWVDQEDSALAATAVSALVHADVPIVAERAMWWPGSSPAGWEESHAEVGATTTATRWALDSGESGFVLIANPGAATARVRVTLTAIGTLASWQADYDVAPTSRTTLRPLDVQPALPPGRYAVVVESVPIDTTSATPVIVEHAEYTPDFRTGSATLATPLPARVP